MKLDAQVTRLDSGVRVATSRVRDVRSVAVGVWIGVGGRYEPAPLCGASHFVEHLLFKGTRTRSAARISREVEGRGGQLNAFTEAEFTCVHARVAAEHLPGVLAILADMALHARLSPRDVGRERLVILDEIGLGRDEPEHRVRVMLDSQLWADHPLGRDLSGTEASVAALDAGRLRAFKERHYTARNTMVTLAGQVDHEACVALVRRRFRGLPPGRPTRFRPAAVAPLRPRVRVETRTVEQAHLAIGVRVFGRRDPRRSALALLGVVLGGNMSSRLFQRIREQRGWAYAIHADVQYFADSGLLAIDAGLDPARAARALGLIFEELRRLRETPVPARELAAAKDYVIGQSLLALEGSHSRMNWLGANLLNYGRVRQPEEVIERIARVTSADVQATARACLRRARTAVALIAPERPGAAAWTEEVERACAALP